MYDREFFTSKLGIAALVSIGVMVTFNLFALTQQTEIAAQAVVVTAQIATLA